MEGESKTSNRIEKGDGQRRRDSKKPGRTEGKRKRGRKKKSLAILSPPQDLGRKRPEPLNIEVV